MIQHLGLAMIDVDGTLRGVTDWKPGARELLDWLTGEDVPIGVCSGRTLESLMLLADDRPGVTHLAAGSGSMAVRRDGDSWTALGQRFLPHAVVDRLVADAEASGMEAWAYTTTQWYAPADTPRVRADIAMTAATPILEGFAGRTDVIKLLVFPEADEHHAVIARATEGPELVLVASSPGYLDIVHAESLATKGGDFLMDDLGIGWESVLAIGDGENDYGMLSRAGVAVALPPTTLDDLAPARAGQRRAACRDLVEALAFVRSAQ